MKRRSISPLKRSITNLPSMKRYLWTIIAIIVLFGDTSVSFPKTHTSRRHSRGPNNIVRPPPKEEFPFSSSAAENSTTVEEELRNIGGYVVNKKEDAKISCNLTAYAFDNRTALDFSTSVKTVVNNLKWYHNGQEVLDFGHRYAKDPDSGQLTINNVRLEDGGIWYCEDVTIGEIGKSVSLVVLEEPRTPYLLIDGRRLDAGNQFVPIKENNELLVKCVVEGGNPPPKINWLLVPGISENPNPDMPVTSVPGLKIVNNSVLTYSSAVVFGEVTLSPVLRVHHNSTICCVVSHVALQSPLNTSVLLDVQYAPSFGISRVPGFGFPLTEGIQLSLKCDVDSNPPSSPIWKRGTGPPPIEQTPDGYLNFTSVEIVDSGWYKCITKYLSVEYSSIGYYLNIREGDYEITELSEFPNKLKIEGSAVEVALGGEIQLECPAGSVSCWARASRPGKNLEPLGPGPKLSLDNIVYQEGGEYKCFVGKSSKIEKWRSRSVQVNVVGAPTIYPSNKNITVVTDQRVTFSLEFCANPPAIKTFWVHEFRSFPPGTTMDDLIAHNVSESNPPYCEKAELTIPSVELHHGGDYMLVVASENGIAGATITLNVTTSVSLTDNIRKGAAHSISSRAAASSSSSIFQTTIVIIIIIAYSLISLFLTTTTTTTTMTFVIP